MTLPSEILSLIFSFSANGELKMIRLACKRFYDIATPLLFNSIFVSARHVDREIAELVASRFSNLIRTLTFSTECYFITTWPRFQDRLNPRFSQCQNLTLHLKLAKHYWKLYCKLGSERQTLYESGAVRAQLSHLLNTLPNLRQIIITDRRHRQDLSWLQEALMGETIQRLPPPETRTPLFSRIRCALADLHRLPKRTTSHRSYREFRAWFLSSFKSEDARALVQLQAIQSIGCGCFDKEPPSSGRPSGLGQAGSQYMPQNPWVEMMTALHMSSGVSIKTISIQPRQRFCCLPLAAIEACDPLIFLSTTTVLARLTQLELRLDNVMLNNYHALAKMHEELKHPTKMLSVASNLQSLTVDFMSAHWNPLFYGRHNHSTTAFGALLGGCELPRLSALHLKNLTFCENEFSAFLQYSPDLRDLSLRGFWMIEQEDSRRLPYANPRSWERLLHTIKETLRRLEHFHMSDRQLIKHEHDSPWMWTTRDFDMMTQRFLLNGGINPFEEIVGEGFAEGHREIP